MKNTANNKFKITARILKLAWKVRPYSVSGYFVGALTQTLATILTFYATAQLSSRLAHYIVGGSSSQIWFWLWVDIFAAILIGLSFWMMSHCKRLLYFRTSSWVTNEF
jgi:hypothetical protein